MKQRVSVAETHVAETHVAETHVTEHIGVAETRSQKHGSRVAE